VCQEDRADGARDLCDGLIFSQAAIEKESVLPGYNEGAQPGMVVLNICL